MPQLAPTALTLQHEQQASAVALTYVEQCQHNKSYMMLNNNAYAYTVMHMQDMPCNRHSTSGFDLWYAWPALQWHGSKGYHIHYMTNASLLDKCINVCAMHAMPCTKTTQPINTNHKLHLVRANQASMQDQSWSNICIPTKVVHVWCGVSIATTSDKYLEVHECLGMTPLLQGWGSEVLGKPRQGDVVSVKVGWHGMVHIWHVVLNAASHKGIVSCWTQRYCQLLKNTDYAAATVQICGLLDVHWRAYRQARGEGMHMS